MFLNRLDIQALSSIRETEREKREQGKHGEMKGKQKKRSMKGKNINSSVLISLSFPKCLQPFKVILQSHLRQLQRSHWNVPEQIDVAGPHTSLSPKPPTQPENAPMSITGMKWPVTSTKWLTSVN